MSLHGTKASFDPLSNTGDAFNEPFTTGFDSTLAQAGTTPSGEAASYYDSFMTARSTMSYITASQEGTASTMVASSRAPLPAQTRFPRLLEQPLAEPSPPPSPAPGTAAGGGKSDTYNPFLDNAQSEMQPKMQSLGSLPPKVLNTSNPFNASGTSLYQQPTTGVAGNPLSFCDVDAASSPQTAATFEMPLDLYDAPDAFTRPNAYTAPTAAAAPAQALPPLYDFAREFSRILPVSEDPASPVDNFLAGDAFWHNNERPPGRDSAEGNNRNGTGSTIPAVTNAAVADAIGGGGGCGGYGSGGCGGYGSGGRSVASAGGGLSSYAAAALLTNTVSVHSPRKAVAPLRIPGLSEPYTMYSITSRSAISPETTVERRFRDVVALTELLQSLFPGCFVPPRPSRNAVEALRMQSTFIEERRAGIERFLRRLVVHPVLGPSEVTQVWLHSATTDLRSCPEWLRMQPSSPPGFAKSTARLLFQVVGVERTVPSPVDVTRPASERGDMYRLVHERAAQMRGVLNKVQPSAIEEKLREEAAVLTERTEALMGLGLRADQLILRSAKCSKVAADLGNALATAAQLEEEGPVSTLAAALRVATEGLSKVSKLCGVATDASAKHLTPLHEWLAAVPGATAALATRERCLLTVATLESDESEAKVKLAEAEARVGGGSGGAASNASLKKVDSLRLLVSQLDVALTAARDEYERVGARNLSEITAFKAHMSRELADAVREFALVQLAAAQKAHDHWAETAGKLESLAATMAAAAMQGGPVLRHGVSIGAGVSGMYGF